MDIQRWLEREHHALLLEDDCPRGSENLLFAKVEDHDWGKSC